MGVVPPLTGAAVNVTDVPAHMGPVGLAVMDTVGVTDGLTTIVMVFDVTVSGLAHGAFDVIRTDIASPFSKPVVV